MTRVKSGAEGDVEEQALDYQKIRVETVGRVRLVTLNEPAKGNAYSDHMGKEITDALTAADVDPEIRAIVVTGAGRHFCVGVDLSPEAENRLAWLRSGDSEKVQEEAEHERIRPWELATPVIAALNGAAVGVGLTLPLQWDLRVVADEGKYGLPFTRRGVIPELNSTWLLPRMIGKANALDLMITGRLVRGPEAVRLGIANESVPAERVVERAMEIARDIAVNTAPAAVSAVKALVNASLMDEDRYYSWDRELEVFAELAAEPDAAEAASAFVERRDPNWTGEKHRAIKMNPTNYVARHREG